jgi:hypothetical protein
MDCGATHGRGCASDDAVLFSGSRARSAAREDREATLELPLLLGGPILRRVEATSVSVWVALSVAARVRLSVWDGRVVTGTPNPMIATPAPGVSTLRLGQKLHIALVTLKPPANSQQTLLSGHVYSYDLEIAPTGTTTRHTLASLHMLERGVFGGREQLPLGYEPGFLPSFAPPPGDLEHLRIVFGSCRRAAHPDPDAMAYIDDIIALDQAYTDALRRPHQLCLGGDQIYADDVSTQHMLALMPVATELVGVAGTDRRPVEQIRLDAVLQRNPAATPTPDDPLIAYPADVALASEADRQLPADRAHFPEGRRLHLTLRAAQMTSNDGDSHLISFGEFAAMYLSVWSNAVWDPTVPLALVRDDPGRSSPARALAWEDVLPATAEIELPDPEFPDRIPKHLYTDPAELTDDERAALEAVRARTPEQRAAAAREARREDAPGQRAVHARLRELRRGLTKVQRALANIPTYMIFDDHEVTDDWNLSPLWRDRVMTTSLGVTIVRNALLAYALFQDWGNDPAKYETSAPHREILTLAVQMFPETAVTGPDPTAAARLDTLFGFDLRGTTQLGGRVAAIKPPVTWHFSVDGPKHRVIALDNRTRRSYGSRNGPPGNVGIDAQLEQIPPAPLPGGRELLVVIAPLQVIGPPLLDELVAPLTYRIFDTVKGFQPDSSLGPNSKTGQRGMLGTNPDAVEAWCFDAVTFEALLKRLAAFGQVVLLSGDVHYTASTLMSYWRKGQLQPARLAQFTSSGFKNVMPAYISAIDRSLGFAQQLVRAKLGVERVGWDHPRDDLVIMPEGMTRADLPPALQARLRDTPVLIPTWGWPDKNVAGQEPKLEKISHLNDTLAPDWVWRARPILDTRPDAQRPSSVRPLALNDAAIDAAVQGADPLGAYVSVAARHQGAVEKLKNARQMLFRGNLGLVRFERRAGKLVAIHEAWTAFADPDNPVPEPPRPAPFMVHEAPLGPEDEPVPGELRAKAIIVVKTPPA